MAKIYWLRNNNFVIIILFTQGAQQIGAPFLFVLNAEKLTIVIADSLTAMMVVEPVVVLSGYLSILK